MMFIRYEKKGFSVFSSLLRLNCKQGFRTAEGRPASAQDRMPEVTRESEGQKT